MRAARDAGVKHFIWSTLPDVEAISGGKFHVPHFTGKAKIDRIVKDAGFVNHTFVIAPFYYQGLLGALAPQKQADGSVGWVLPLDQLRKSFTWATSTGTREHRRQAFSPNLMRRSNGESSLL